MGSLVLLSGTRLNVCQGRFIVRVKIRHTLTRLARAKYQRGGSASSEFCFELFSSFTRQMHVPPGAAMCCFANVP